MDNKKITINDVAKELGVSKTTVSRAISGQGRIGAETRRKVLEYISEHNYKPSVMAKGLAQSKTYNIAVTLPGDQNLIELPFFQNCLIGICNTLNKTDYTALLTVTHESDFSQLKRIIVNQKADGIILTRNIISDPAITYLKESRMPFVVIGDCADHNVYQVDHDHVTACRDLTRSLHLQGYNKLALITGNTRHVVTRSRIKGFTSAYTDAEQATLQNMIFTDANTISEIHGKTEEALQSGVDCIVCADDFICNTVLTYLKSKSVSKASDVKIASFYNSPLLKQNTPSVSSIDFNALDLGATSARVLLELLSEREAPKQTLLGYKIVLSAQ